MVASIRQASESFLEKSQLGAPHPALSVAIFLKRRLQLFNPHLSWSRLRVLKMGTRIQQSVKPAFPRMDMFSCPPMGLHNETTKNFLSNIKERISAELSSESIRCKEVQWKDSHAPTVCGLLKCDYFYIVDEPEGQTICAVGIWWGLSEEHDAERSRERPEPPMVYLELPDTLTTAGIDFESILGDGWRNYNDRNEIEKGYKLISFDIKAVGQEEQTLAEQLIPAIRKAYETGFRY